MKKLLAFIILSIAMVACYNNYITDYLYTGVYFPYQQDVRTFVVGEGMQFQVGAALGGTRKNTVDRDVSFKLDNTLLTAARLASMQTASGAYIKNPTLPVAALLPLPANYYTISDPGTMVIKATQHEGAVTIKPDSTLFLNDSLKTMYATYAMPFYITAADVDSIIEPKRSNVVGVRFDNMLFGMYWHTGAAVLSKKNLPAVDSITVVYRYSVNDGATKIWTLTTFGPSTLYANGYFNQTTAKNEMKLVLKGTTVFVSAGAAYTGQPATAPTNTVLSSGTSTFNRPLLLQNRKIFLKYKYVSNLVTYSCTDTLIFRNRIRDGVNEWQDENPAHYLK